MGGNTDTLWLTGNASGIPDLHELAAQVEISRQNQEVVKIVCIRDYIFTDIDGRKYKAQREWNLAPEQFRFEFAPDAEPEPTPPNVIGYVNTSAGMPLNVRDQPTTAGKLVSKVYRGDKLELRPGWTETANGFTWWQILKVNSVAVSEGATWYAVDKYLSATRPQ